MSKPPFNITGTAVFAGNPDGTISQREVSELPTLLVCERASVLSAFLVKFAQCVRLETMRHGAFFLPPDVFIGRGYAVAREEIVSGLSGSPHFIILREDCKGRQNFFRMDVPLSIQARHEARACLSVA